MSKQEEFVSAFNEIAKVVNFVAVEHGWWEGDRNDGELIALMHSELSEALEGLRHGNGPSDHIPEFSAVEEELADVIVRIMDFAVAKNTVLQRRLLQRYSLTMIVNIVTAARNFRSCQNQHATEEKVL